MSDMIEAMKLIIQIPCYNEAQTLPLTIRDLPCQITGVHRIEVVVIDDGSNDGTAAVAKACGVDHLVRLKSHQGLAAAFRAGLNACVQLGADIIVNTDADNPFHAGDIPRLIGPILKQEADLVIGVRPTDDVRHFSRNKRILQRLGSWMVSRLTRLHIPDPTSGFRAYSREAALRLNIVSSYTYVLESIIQAANKGLRIAHVPINTNEPLRQSRLIKNTPHYLVQSVLTIFRIYLMYQPLRFFLIWGGIFFGLGMAAGVRFHYAYASGQGAEHFLWLIVSVVLLVLGIQMGLFGLVSDLIAGNRRLVEEALYRVRAQELKETGNSRAQGAA